MKVFLSLPMRGRTDEEIENEIEMMEKCVKQMFGPDVECIHNFNPDEDDKKDKSPTYLLGRAIQKMGECDIIAFSPNYKSANGCAIELDVAIRYNMTYIIFSSYFFIMSKDSIEKVVVPTPNIKLHIEPTFLL